MLQWQLKVGVEDLVDSFPSLSFRLSPPRSAAKKPNACQETHDAVLAGWQRSMQTFANLSHHLLKGNVIWMILLFKISREGLHQLARHPAILAYKLFTEVRETDSESVSRADKKVKCTWTASSRLKIRVWITSQIKLWFEIFVVDRKVAADYKDLGAVHKLPPK